MSTASKLLFTTCLLSSVAVAQTQPLELDGCTDIDDDAARLACYDALVQADRVVKRPVDLTQTLKNTIAGHPKIVIQEDESSLHHVLTDLGLSQEALTTQSPLSLSYDLERNSERGLWSARTHNANYLLPLYVSSTPNYQPATPTQLLDVPFDDNDIRKGELKFQVSLKTKTAENLFGTDADLWLGYTQLSHWQVYNEDNSRPFRVHDYEPELFMTQPVSASLPFGGRLRMLGAGGVHHSNGEADPLSRSWNRLYVMGGAEWGRLTVMPRLWMRVSKQDGKKPSDNPDIQDYYGYGDVKFIYQLQQGGNVSGLARLNPLTGKGALQINYAYPLRKGVTGYIQTFHGYGQSIIDYNHKTTSIGAGIMLADWMGL